MAFSKLKAHPRKAAEHTIPRLLRRIGRVVTDFSAGTFFAMQAKFEPDRNTLLVEWCCALVEGCFKEQNRQRPNRSRRPHQSRKTASEAVRLT